MVLTVGAGKPGQTPQFTRRSSGFKTVCQKISLDSEFYRLAMASPSQAKRRVLTIPRPITLWSSMISSKL